MSEDRAQLVWPWDVLIHLVHVADPPALALLSRVSFDFLQAAGPLLYGSVVISSRLQMERLLCSTPKEEDEVSPHRITPFLSLSQTQHLTLDYTFHSSSSADHLNPSVRHLLPNSRLDLPSILKTPLQIHSLRILLSHSTAQPTQHLIRTELLHRFNPSIFKVTIVQVPPRPHLTLWSLIGDPYTAPQVYDRWDRLDKLVLDGALPFAVREGAEVVLDLRRAEGQAGPPQMSMGSTVLPISRASFARRLVMMKMVGREGRLRLLVGSEEEREWVLREGEAFEQRVRGNLDVEVRRVR